MTWAVLKVRIGGEIRAARDLEEIFQVNSYYPIICKSRRLPRHLVAKEGKAKTRITFPVFPGYIFVPYETLDRPLAEYRERVKSLVTVVRYRGEYARVRDEQIDGIKLLAEQGFYENLSLEQRLDLFTAMIGATVRVTKGPFKGVIGEVSAIRDHRVSIDGRYLRFEADEQALEAAY